MVCANDCSESSPNPYNCQIIVLSLIVFASHSVFTGVFSSERAQRFRGFTLDTIGEIGFGADIGSLDATVSALSGAGGGQTFAILAGTPCHAASNR